MIVQQWGFVFNLLVMAVIRRRERRNAREKRKDKFWVRKIFQNRAELGNFCNCDLVLPVRRHFPRGDQMLCWIVRRILQFRNGLWGDFSHTIATNTKSDSHMIATIAQHWSQRSPRWNFSQRSRSQRSWRSPAYRFPYDRWWHFAAIVTIAAIIWEPGLKKIMNTSF